MTEIAQDPKLKAILEAAWSAFAAYGFRKTSMDDIANGAAMSRPALYLHFKNKEDIFRSLCQYFYETQSLTVREALQQPGPQSDVLAAAIMAQGSGLVQEMMSSPHGLELLDTGKTTARDIAEAGEANLSAIYAQWLARHAETGAIRLHSTPDLTAEAITSTLKGLKFQASGYASYHARLSAVAALFGAGISA
ncbi:MAG: TetR/AcrR family transcriptional regulator [Sedimentitalea sp.]